VSPSDPSDDRDKKNTIEAKVTYETIDSDDDNWCPNSSKKVTAHIRVTDDSDSDIRDTDESELEETERPKRG
jgi:hypothetical protein